MIEDRRKLTEGHRAVAAGQVPVLAGVIDTTTPRGVEHARTARAAPFYAPSHPLEFPDRFRAIRAAVDLPLVPYDIPGSVGSNPQVEPVVEPARSPR